MLDIGCTGRCGDMSTGEWLHVRIRRVAARCVGADYDKEAVEKLQREGFDAHQFDVVVAGELIEHLRDPVKLLDSRGR